MSDFHLRKYFTDNGIVFPLNEHNNNHAREFYVLGNKTEVFANAFSLLSMKANTMDGLYEYLFIRKMVSLKTFIGEIKDEKKKEGFLSIINLAEAAFAKVNNGDIVRFINANYKEIIENGYNPDMFLSATIDFVLKCGSGITDDVYNYLCRSLGLGIVSYYTQFEKYLEKHAEAFEFAIPCIDYKDFKEKHAFLFGTTLGVFASIMCKNTSALMPHTNKLVKELHDSIVKTVKSLTIKTVIQYAMDVKDYYTFLKGVKSPLANEFSEYAEKTEKLLTEHILRFGMCSTHIIQVDDVIKKIKESEELYVYSLTHRPCAEEAYDDNSCLSIEPKEESITHRISRSNLDSDGYFTISQQQYLQSVAATNSVLFLNILQDSALLNRYLKELELFFTIIGQNNSSFDDQTMTDRVLLVNMIVTMAKNIDADNETFSIICYGTVMFICAMIEKILRLSIIDITKEERYIPAESFSLGMMLAPIASPLKGMFSENHLKNLSFYLIKSEESRIGENIRNSLAHWSGMSQDQLTPLFAAKLLWLFTDVINTVTLYYYMHDRKDAL